MGWTKPIEWVRDGDCFRSTNHSFSTCGYPMMQRDGHGHGIARHILKHRLGELPPSVQARHTCDHKWCIRPDHIISGTNAENMKDKIGRIVYRRGESHGNAKLSDQNVTEIQHLLSLGEKSQSKIAILFGIDRTMVSRIKRGVHRRQPKMLSSPQYINQQ